MSDVPVCECHGEPMWWNKDASMKAGGRWRCVVKKREYDRANREKKREYDRAYHAANREKKSEYGRAYYEANREKIKEKQEDELVNNGNYGLLNNVHDSMRVKPRAGAPTPDDLDELLGPLPVSVIILALPQSDIDLVHIFTNSRDELFRELAEYVRIIKQNGAIWVSWYKKAAKLPTEITEDTVRQAAFPLGLVDIKVCSVDENWSGLKLVIRRENRI